MTKTATSRTSRILRRVATPVRIERTRNRHSRALVRDDTVVIRLARNLSEREERRHVESLVRRMAMLLEKERSKITIDPFFPLVDGQLEEVEALVHHINALTLRVPVSKIRLRPMTTQWGSCSTRGNITLNTALLKLPKHVMEYVIVHELAHRRHGNHSRRFWDLVEQHCPFVHEARKEMRNYRLCRQ